MATKCKIKNIPFDEKSGFVYQKGKKRRKIFKNFFKNYKAANVFLKLSKAFLYV